MNQVDLIARKRDGLALSEDELEFLVSGYVDGRIPDYQISAFLMAVYFQGMTDAEAATLTRLMRDSGIVLDHGGIAGVKADKHSTGGVGDKVSLVLAPLAASAGLVVPMISGRALAHTGGTLDKLEAIPGFQTQLSESAIKKQLVEIGVVLIGQTSELTPADKKIYALRDATATVDSIPLITASILSKKMAEGIDVLVLDVKAGSGAIFKDTEYAWKLAKKLVRTADVFGLKTAAVITNMAQPLGNTIGNWLETREAIETLKGDGPADLKELSVLLTARMLLLGGLARDLDEATNLLEAKLASGAALDKFMEIVERQGGDTAVVEQPERYTKAKCEWTLESPQSGFISKLHCRELGLISMALGAGRKSMQDGIDYTAGIVLHKKVGEPVTQGEPVLTAYSGKEALLQEQQSRLEQTLTVSDNTPEFELIYGIIDSDGEQRYDLPA